MNKKITPQIFVLMLLWAQVVFSQSININHQYQGNTIYSMSFGGSKMGWVTIDNSISHPYHYHYMDSMMNVVSVNDTNLLSPNDTSLFSLGFDAGDRYLSAKMDNNGHLWGLFFDITRSSNIQIQLGTGGSGLSCDTSNFYLYDFDAHQRHYLNLNIPDCQLLTLGEANYALNFSSDTIFIDLFCSKYDFFTGYIPSNLCVKWVNGAVVSQGTLNPNFQWTADALIDENNKHNLIFFDGFGQQSWEQTEGLNNAVPISYNQVIPIPTPLTYIFDATLHNGSAYYLAFQPPFHRILIRNNTGDQIISTNFATGNYYTNKICVDHADRIWVYRHDSVFMYNGAWHSFSLQGALPYSATPYLNNEVKNFQFVEYATNKYAVSYGANQGYSYSNFGNGIIFFNYVDSSIVGLNHIQGKVFYDANTNNTYDTGEPYMVNQLVSAGTVSTNVYLNGIYNLYVSSGVQNVVTSNSLPYLTTVPAAYNFNFVTQTDTLGVDFAVQHNAPTNDLRIDLVAGLHRNNNTVWYGITYKNTGSSAASGTVTMQYNPSLTYTYCATAPSTSTAGNLTWSFSNLQPFESHQLYVAFNSGTNFNIGDTVYAQASIDPILGDAIPADNTDSTMSIFIGPFDPNIKEVTQNGAGVNTITNTDPLEYIIHFQNVGNDTAFTVIVNDTISDLLDLSTLEIIGSSHNYVLGIYNRTLQFTFTGINLPDSGTNMAASMGFVAFRIKPVASISIGQIINNTAAIYFDANAPITTNNAFVTFADVTAISSPSNSPNTIQVVPNPAHHSIYIAGKHIQNQTVTIYDAVGKTVLRTPVNSNQSIDVSQLNQGIYFVELAGQRVKFVKE